jgi:dipeptidyl aminopeptidase/acylaminoacyl peptidase
MKRDIRDSILYREIESYYRAIHEPGTGLISDAADVCVEPNGRRVVLTGTLYETLARQPATRLCIVDLADGELQQLQCPSNNDGTGRWSPDGQWLAFLSDRRNSGDYQLHLVAASAFLEVIETPQVEGVVEYLHWSPDSRRILLGVAGYGADLAGCQGGATLTVKASDLPDWMPEVDSGAAANLWRSLHVYDVVSRTTTNVSRKGINYWEACWLGNSALVAIVSDYPGEGSWYRARLITHDLASGDPRTLYSPMDQIGLPAASPSGREVAIVEAVCSDRLIVCGTLKLIDTTSGGVSTVDTRGIEVTHTIWRDDHYLTLAGHRGCETLVADCAVTDRTLNVHWSSIQRTLGAWYPAIWPLPRGGAVGIGESYQVAPELVVLVDGGYEVVRSFASAASRQDGFNAATVEPVTWAARDGLEIQGWLIRPPGAGPFPLVMDIHGGPVWQCRNRWAGRLRGAKVLADHGIASLYPNPRGSSGRGQAFARLVKGDMGGEDTYDYLTGCDAMVACGIADPSRLGVTGISYGGFASCWLITQDWRFTAAVPISPVTNWYSLHRTSQIPSFDELFLDGSAYEAGGKFFERSPAMLARRVKTPTLQIAGALDQNTPPTQALEFHRSLLENGVTSVLVTYPKGVHGLRTFPDVIDATSRYVGWFLKYFRLQS